jgi:hypothetical protein
LPSRYVPKKNRYRKIPYKHCWIEAEAVSGSVEQFQDFLILRTFVQKALLLQIFPVMKSLFCIGDADECSHVQCYLRDTTTLLSLN